MDNRVDLEVEIFTNARHITEASARERYIQEACGVDAILVRRIRSLLRVMTEETTFLEFPVETSTFSIDDYGDTETVGSVIGPYELIESIGAGGMGIVFRAQQTSPVRRQVALKIIRPGMHTSDAIRRFETERQTLAQLNHSCITRLLDAGTTATGRPWFVMELVQGLPITIFCSRKSLPLSDRLRLFESVCEAVQHAHENGVLHRDLKPANILVTGDNGRYVPKVIDFGVARVTLPKSVCEQDAPRPHTEQVVFAGTPAYMSPEQTCLPDHALDARCDVYSMGILLYELLTEASPYSGILRKDLDYQETLRVIREVSPPLPSACLQNVTLPISRKSTFIAAPGSFDPNSTEKSSTAEFPKRSSSELKGDLDWITMKAIEKDRERRYSSVADFAADLRRYLNNEPVAAGPPSRIYRLKKLVRRRRARFAIAALLLSLLIFFCIAGVTAWSLNRQQSESDKQIKLMQVEQQQSATRERIIGDYDYVNDIQAAYAACGRGEIQQARSRLQKYGDRQESLSQTGFEWHFLRRLCKDRSRTLQARDGIVFDVEFSPDGRFLVSCLGNRNCCLQIWDVAAGTLVHSIDYLSDVNSACFSADGMLLLTGDETRRIRVFDTQTWHEINHLDGFQWPIGQIYLAHDNRTVIAAEIDWPTRKARTTVRDLQDHEKSTSLEGHRLLDVDDSKGVAAFASDDGYISLRSFPNLELINRFSDRLLGTICGSFSPSGRFFAAGSIYNASHVWDLSNASEISQLIRRGHSSSVRDIEFSADDRFIITASTNAVLEVWDVASRSVQMVFHPNSGGAWSIGIAAKNSNFALGYENGDIQIFDGADVNSLRRSIVQSVMPFQDVASDSKCRRLAIIASDQMSITVYSSDDGRILQSIAAPFDERFLSTAFSADNRDLLVTNASGELLRIDLTTMKTESRFTMCPGALLKPLVSSDGHLLGVNSAIWPDGHSSVWHLEEQKELHRLPTIVSQTDGFPYRIWQFLDESSVLVSGQTILTRWDFKSAKEIPPRFESPGKMIHDAAYLPDSNCALTCLGDGTIQLLDFAKNHSRAILEGHKSIPIYTAISPNGRTLATASLAGEVRLWHLGTDRPLYELPGLTGEAMGLWFSGDGKRLIAAAKTYSGGSEVVVWDAGESE